MTRGWPRGSRNAAPRQKGSHAKTSDERARLYMDGLKAGKAVSTQLSGVQPSEVCVVRSGRGCVNRMISLLRTPNICPVTSAAAALIRATGEGAIFAAVIR